METLKKVTAKDGVDVYYGVTREPGMNKPVKVMHPGGGMNRSSFEGLRKRLNEKGHPTIVIEQRGCGNSRVPNKSEYFDLDRYSSDVESIVNKESVENPSYVCHSIGFMPIIDYISRTGNAKDVNGICVSHNFKETTIPGALTLFSKFLIYGDYLAGFITEVAHQINRTKRDYNDQSNLEGKSDFAIWLTINDVPYGEIRKHPTAMQNSGKWDISKQLGKIKVPIHLIHGNHDLMVMPCAGEKIRQLTKGECTTDILSGTHTLPYANPKAVLETLNKYE